VNNAALQVSLKKWSLPSGGFNASRVFANHAAFSRDDRDIDGDDADADASIVAPPATKPMTQRANMAFFLCFFLRPDHLGRFFFSQL